MAVFGSRQGDSRLLRFPRQVFISMQKHGFLINGKWLTEGPTETIHAPHDQSAIGEVHLASRAQVEQAIAAADAAFKVTRKLATHERQDVLRKVGAALVARKEEFARQIALEAGKPIRTARVEVERAIFTFALAVEEAGRMGGERIPLDFSANAAAEWGLVKRFPSGPVTAITPFNFPLNLVAHKLAPAIAVGCSIVLKPAPQTPITALMLAKVIQEAGYPDGGLNVVPTSNDDAAPLIEDDRMKVLSFTGSAKVGWELKTRAGKKRVLLELGGNAGVIIHSDADIERAATRCAVGGFSYAGQSCISVQRIFVEKSKYDAFVAALVPKVKALKVGDPMDESTDVGPLIRQSDAVRVEQWIAEAKSQGAEVLYGGERKGSYITPALLTKTKRDQKVNCEEIFGPVVTVAPYETFDEALNVVNDSRYGLQAGVFTHDARLIDQAFAELEVGGVVINEVPTYRSDNMPYGGVKDSGLGREGVRYAMEEMTEPKILVWGQE